MGGNVFKGKTQSIKLENIQPTVDLYFQELARVFPGKKDIFNNKKMKYIGSVGKKPVSGDVDFAIDVSSIIDKKFTDKSIQKWGLNPDEVKKQMLAFKKRARSATDSELMLRALLKGIVTKINAYAENLYCDEKKITSGNIFGLFPQYTEAGEKLDYGVQIDWMIGDIDLLEFSYFSDKYEGNVKGLHRTQLILAMFQFYGYSFNHTKGLTDKDTGERLAIKPADIVPYLEKAMGTKLSKNTLNNYFKLVTKLDEIPKKDRDSILNIYFKILSHTRTDIPLNLQDDWRRLNKKEHYETKFLPDDSLLKENLDEISSKLNMKESFKDFLEEIIEGTIVNRSYSPQMSRENEWKNRDNRFLKKKKKK